MSDLTDTRQSGRGEVARRNNSRRPRLTRGKAGISRMDAPACLHQTGVRRVWIPFVRAWSLSITQRPGRRGRRLALSLIAFLAKP
jgi:hypothetical protein